MDLDIPPVPDRLLADAAEALHEACCSGRVSDDHVDPEFRELDRLAHLNEADTVLDVAHARLHAVSLRWAANRIRAECTLRWDDGDCCSRCHDYAERLHDWAVAAAQHHPATHTRPDPAAPKEARP